MAVAIPFVIAAAGAVSAMSAIQQGRTAMAAGEYNSKVNQQNAELARVEARDTVTQQQRETMLRLGAARAASAKSGGITAEGSALDILGDIAAQSKLEQQYTTFRGSLGERGYLNTASLDRMTGRQGQLAGYLRAGSDLLSGAGGGYKASSQLNQAGAGIKTTTAYEE